MDIREFRAVLSSAFRDEGFEEKRLAKGLHYKVWVSPGGDITRFFGPDAQRRPWGFQLFGIVGIDIPDLRRWLSEYKPGAASGIFQTCFVGYHTANEDIFREFHIDNGLPVPADLWVGLIKDRLNLIPRSLDDLVRVYKVNREELGWLAHPHDKAAWDFLLAWLDNPDPSLPVPYRLPNGPIVWR